MNSLTIILCNTYQQEALTVKNFPEFENVQFKFFPAQCTYPYKKNIEQEIRKEIQDSNGDTLIFVCSRINMKQFGLDLKERCEIITFDNCLEMVIMNSLLKSYLDCGYYILTPERLKTWKTIIEEFRGNREIARQFYAECTTKIILLDTNTEPKSADNLNDMSNYLDCPAEIIPVGIEYFRLFLLNKINSFHSKFKDIEPKENGSTKLELVSDYAMALHLLGELPKNERESSVIERILELLKMLFSPEEAYYLPLLNSLPAELISVPVGSGNKDVYERIKNYKDNIGLTASEKGFYFKIESGNEIIAIVELNNLLMPQYIKKYQNFALAISGALMLAIENARSFETILENQEKIRQSERIFRTLFEATPIGVAIVDSRTGKYLQVNKKYCEILDYSENEADSKYIININFFEEIKKTSIKLDLLFSGEETFLAAEEKFIRKDGYSFWISLRILKLYDESEIEHNFLVLLDDITELKRTEAERFRKRNLESLGALAGGIAHDFNNLLAGILGFTELIIIDSQEKTVIEKAKKITKSSEKAVQLAEMLITFASGGSPLKTKISIREAIQEAIDFSSIGNNYECQLAGTDTIDADFNQLVQALKNIIINAYDAMDEIGKVKINTSVLVINNFEWIKISVLDTGKGIPEENLEKVFDPYFSTKGQGSTKGKGLGLSVTFSIIKRHGGTITIDSKLGEGTKVDIVLPVNSD